MTSVFRSNARRYHALNVAMTDTNFVVFIARYICHDLMSHWDSAKQGGYEASLNRHLNCSRVSSLRASPAGSLVAILVPAHLHSGMQRLDACGKWLEGGLVVGCAVLLSLAIAGIAMKLDW